MLVVQKAETSMGVLKYYVSMFSQMPGIKYDADAYRTKKISRFNYWCQYKKSLFSTQGLLESRGSLIDQRPPGKINFISVTSLFYLDTF